MISVPKIKCRIVAICIPKTQEGSSPPEIDHKRLGNDHNEKKHVAMRMYRRDPENIVVIFWFNMVIVFLFCYFFFISINLDIRVEVIRNFYTNAK